jgi:hypothetical protein
MSTSFRRVSGANQPKPNIQWYHPAAAEHGRHGPSRPSEGWTRPKTTISAATGIAMSCWREPTETKYTRYHPAAAEHGCHGPSRPSEGWTRPKTTSSAPTKTSHNTQLSRPQLPEAGPGPKQPNATDSFVKRASSVLLTLARDCCVMMVTNGTVLAWGW